MMSIITFIGEGPSPSEVSRFYQPELPLPFFRQRYKREFEEMYMANGLHLSLVLASVLAYATLEEIIDCKREPGDKGYFGPVIVENSLILGGLALWRPRESGIERLSSAS